MGLLVCYVNLCAALADVLLFLGWTPVLRDPWGQGVQIVRLVSASGCLWLRAPLGRRWAEPEPDVALVTRTHTAGRSLSRSSCGSTRRPPWCGCSGSSLTSPRSRRVRTGSTQQPQVAREHVHSNGPLAATPHAGAEGCGVGRGHALAPHPRAHPAQPARGRCGGRGEAAACNVTQACTTPRSVHVTHVWALSLSLLVQSSASQPPCASTSFPCLASGACSTGESRAAAAFLRLWRLGWDTSAGPQAPHRRSWFRRGPTWPQAAGDHGPGLHLCGLPAPRQDLHRGALAAPLAMGPISAGLPRRWRGWTLAHGRGAGEDDSGTRCGGLPFLAGVAR